MRKYKIGVLGLGRGMTFARQFQSLPESQTAALRDAIAGMEIAFSKKDASHCVELSLAAGETAVLDVIGGDGSR